jgi:hypothetical protein
MRAGEAQQNAKPNEQTYEEFMEDPAGIEHRKKILA